MWHKYKRSLKPSGLELSAVNFIPVSGENVELMQVTVKNISRKTIRCTPTFAIALFGRSRDNKHDHEHVTALLNRVQQRPEGVLMQTAMAFNEEGHQESRCVYFVFGREDKGAASWVLFRRWIVFMAMAAPSKGRRRFLKIINRLG